MFNLIEFLIALTISSVLNVSVGKAVWGMLDFWGGALGRFSRPMVFNYYIAWLSADIEFVLIEILMVDSKFACYAYCELCSIAYISIVSNMETNTN